MITTTILSGCASDRRVLKQDTAAEKPPAAEEAVKEPPALRSIELTNDGMTISAEAPFSYSISKPDDPFRLVVELDGVLPGRYTGEVLTGNGVVAEARTAPGEPPKEGTTLSLLLASPVEMLSDYSDGILKLTASETVGFLPEEEVIEEPEMVSEADEMQGEGLDLAKISEETAIGQDESAGISGRKPAEPEVRRVDLNFQDADIPHIFRFFADVSDFNIVIDPGVKGKITLKLTDVPWTQALDIILKTHNLGKVVDNNIIRIAPLATILKEKEAEVMIESAEQLAEPLVTRVFMINFADVTKVKDSILQSGILTERGHVSADERVSSLIVKDIESSMPEVENLVKVLDRPTKQVLIEARIVEASTTATSEIGIQWGGGVYGNDKTEFYGGNANLNTGATSGFPFIVDFPTALTTSTRGAGLRFGFLNPTGTIGLDIQLSMLEATGKGKVISRPRVMTLDNKEAMIAQGDQIPVRTTTRSENVITTSIEFKDVRLELKVKPHVTPDDHISMEVMIKKNEAKTTLGTVDEPSAILTNEASTNVIIRSGMTIVIGGIHKTKKEDSTRGIPVLSHIPVIGNIFKYQKKIDNTTELLIFITPSVVEPG